MFDKLKQINELRKLHSELKNEKATVEKRGVMVVMNGNFEVENIKLNIQLSVEDQQSTSKEVFNEVHQEIQNKLTQKMMDSRIGF